MPAGRNTIARKMPQLAELGALHDVLFNRNLAAVNHRARDIEVRLAVAPRGVLEKLEAGGQGACCRQVGDGI